MATILDGKALAAKIKEEAAAGVRALDGKPCGLAVVLVGDDPASAVYVRNKRKDCQEVGIKAFDYDLPQTCTQAELDSLLDQLNANPEVSGILVQMPLPRHLDAEHVIEYISSSKDADGFHPQNLGKLVRGLNAPRPCTPAGVMRILKEYGIETSGKRAVVIGRSNIVGKPMSIMLCAANATVTTCHSRTQDMRSICAEADIIVSACGQAKMIKADWVKPGAVVIDVGMNKDEAGKLCGDVDFEQVAPIAGAITPVPGGVGPMTRAMLLLNTVTAAQRATGLDVEWPS